MEKEKKAETQRPASFVVNEKALFAPRVGDKEEILVVSVPAAGTTKYGCKFAGDSIVPVNGCYLQKIAE